MDHAGAWVPTLSPAHIDLHLHSTASDGVLPPAAVVQSAAALGLSAVALTDHDTVAGVPEAVAEGGRCGVRVVSGCEFSAAAPWGGEMHVLGYFLPTDDPELEAFLRACRDDRVRRGREMVEGLRAWGMDVSFEDLEREAGGAAIGRPHLARLLTRRGSVGSVEEAFQLWLGRGRPAYVEKRLPGFAEVAAAVHRVGGIVSAAHLKERGTRASLTMLREQGLDAIEIRHPGHSEDARARLAGLAHSLGFLTTGGSDWHGEAEREGGHSMLGSEDVPVAWLEALDRRRGAANGGG
ncbi:MAG TPA: PHP domain-containing protein [Gemmatimonadales bacterium]|nr:PHP domain-containing protein [Gemmatimonadales bacterium]